MKPIFATGKTNERSEGGSLNIGETSIPVATASTYFSAGNPIFISEAAGTEVEYLGEAVSVSTTIIVVPYALVEAKGAGYKVWKPTSSVVMPYAVSSPWERNVPLGVQTQRTQAGTPYRTKISDSYTLITLNWNDLPESNYTSLITFIITTLNNGINNCSIGYYDYSAGRIYSVIATLLMNELPHYEAFPEYTPISIPFQVISAGTYQA